MGVFQRLGPRSDGSFDGGLKRCREPIDVFQRLGPRERNQESMDPKGANVFQRLGPCSDGGDDRVLKKNRQEPVKALCADVFQPMGTIRVFQRSGPSVERVLKKKNSEMEVRRICKYWLHGTCRFGDNCRFLHPSASPCFSFLAELEGHHKAITGMAIPSENDKLYSGSKDKSVRVWQKGECVATIDVESEVECLISCGPWVFMGLKDLIKVWRTHREANHEEIDLVVRGKVRSLAVCSDLLCAGIEEGTIFVWSFNSNTNAFKLAGKLEGHTSAVVTLADGANKVLYSGSTDKTVKIWNLEKLECSQTLTGYPGTVMKVLYMAEERYRFVLSGSLDGTLKIWRANPVTGTFELLHTRKEAAGVLTLCGMCVEEGESVLLCSCNDNTVRAYDLPSFAEKGKIVGEHQVRSIHVKRSKRMILTADEDGLIEVWKWSTPALQVEESK